MSKFAKASKTARPHGPTKTTDASGVRTHEGGRAFSLDPQTELFTLAVSHFVAEDTFYEKASTRDDRFVGLIRQLADEKEGADWLAKFIPWLRNEANMRTASVVAAVEYARDVNPDAEVSGRALLAKSLSRADEPAEALAYWLATYGRKMPAAVKRGIADAASRLYTDYGITKYDSQGANVRPGDVIELTHPKPVSLKQSRLFTYALDVRHGRGDPRIDMEFIPDIAALREWHKNPTLENVPRLITWEQLSSHFKMDAKAWESVIPSMGYMALLRNLRNFENANVSGDVLDAVACTLTDPEEVARSRQLPFRFWNAYDNIGGTRFVHPLEVALDLSVRNVPMFKGNTLILVDTSGSMQSEYTSKGKLTAVQAAALFGAAVTRRSENHWLSIFASYAAWVQSKPSVLRTMEDINRSVGSVGHGTEIDQSVRWALSNMNAKPDRIFIFTDMQAHPSHLNVSEMVPKSTPIHVWDLRGYGRANIELSSGRYLHAGLSDQSFKTVQLLESFRPGVWPWEAE